MAGPFQGPEQVAVARLAVDPDRGAVGQDHVQLQDVVDNQAVQAFLATVAAPERGAYHADALARAGGDEAVVPEMMRDVAHQGAASEPGRLATGLDGDLVELPHADLDATECAEARIVVMP